VLKWKKESVVEKVLLENFGDSQEAPSETSTPNKKKKKQNKRKKLMMLKKRNNVKDLERRLEELVK